MSGIDALAEKLKKKTENKKIEKSTLQKVNTSKQQLVKRTIYLPTDINQELDEFYAKRILQGIRENKYDIIAQAIKDYIRKG
jgi:uncharacterized protein YajQ (UPF0234 family)